MTTPLPSFRPDVFTTEPPTLFGMSCAACAVVSFPPREVCPACGSDAVTSHALGGHGTLYSFTVVRQAPPGLPAPYLLGYVDLVSDQVRVLARLEGFTEDDITIGAPVTLGASVIDGPESTTQKFVFRPFVPAEELS